jgi:hypothetical protein
VLALQEICLPLLFYRHSKTNEQRAAHEHCGLEWDSWLVVSCCRVVAEEVSASDASGDGTGVRSIEEVS